MNNKNDFLGEMHCNWTTMCSVHHCLTLWSSNDDSLHKYITKPLTPGKYIAIGLYCLRKHNGPVTMILVINISKTSDAWEIHFYWTPMCSWSFPVISGRWNEKSPFESNYRRWAVYQRLDLLNV